MKIKKILKLYKELLRLRQEVKTLKSDSYRVNQNYDS